MSSLINKVKDKLHSDNKTEQPEGTHGPHSSRAANAADPRIDSDRDHRENLGKHDGSYTTGGDNYSYGAGNTATTGTTGFGSGPASKTAGMHSSNLANKADPRVDSDLDASRNMGMKSHGATHGATHDTTTTGTTGTSGTTSYGTGSHSTQTAGMHSSNLANKADPRVDSDLDGSRNMGMKSHGATHGTTTTGSSTGTSGTTGFGSGSNATRTAGMHSSDMANKLDPRVDSDLDGSRNMGMKSHGATHGTGSTNTHDTSLSSGGMGTDSLGSGGLSSTTGSTGAYGTTGGAHPSTGFGTTSEFSTGDRNLGQNTSALGGDSTTSAYGGGMGSVGGGFGNDRQTTGPAPSTAGPHKSDMMNKVDPRVDSDLDNSKTVGGDKTFAQSDSRTTAKDPTDAAQVPPSVLQKHIGKPSIEHDNHSYDRERRHSVHQREQHHGL
ncbi:hypothetical protein MKX07_001621 [Trichoderma sp. CBMAI-0711]|nr:hypothetical protein MKX07_001621 [Trichoderma sp. CBMAI-0711]